MTSRKSTSNSVRSHRVPVRRSRTLKRGAGYHLLSDGDWPFLIAAYKKGTFDNVLLGLQQTHDLPEIEELTNEEFRALFTEFFREGEHYILTARTSAFKTLDGQVPVGLVDTNPDNHRMTPRVLWFPWASPRNRIEATVKFLDDHRKENLILIFDDEQSHRFFVRMAQYGILNRVGIASGRIPFWENGEKSVIWGTN